jgi:hypothetical protein
LEFRNFTEFLNYLLKEPLKKMESNSIKQNKKTIDLKKEFN